MDLTLTTAPDDDEVLNIVNVAGLKSNLRISYTAEDAFIEECIRESYAYLDGRSGWLNRSILTQTWTLKLPGFKKRIAATDDDDRPSYDWIATDEIELPLPPLQSVTSVKYLVDGVLTTLSTSSYVVVTGDTYGKIALADGAYWPDTIDTHPQAVQIEFVAGYGDGAAVLAKARGIAKAMKLLGSDFFRNREDTYAEPRLVAVNRKIVNGLEKIAGRYKLPNRHA